MQYPNKLRGAVDFEAVTLVAEKSEHPPDVATKVASSPSRAFLAILATVAPAQVVR